VVGNDNFPVLGQPDLFVLWETGNIMRKSRKSSDTIKDSQIKKPHHIPVAICILAINLARHLFIFNYAVINKGRSLSINERFVNRP
jgi:hypothetical protein